MKNVKPETDNRFRRNKMEEKTYKTMSGTGALSVTIGVIVLVVGIASGVLMIISGAKLLSGRNKIMF